MPRYKYQSITIRLPKTLDHQLHTHRFVYTCGKITHLFKKALQELIEHDDQKINQYLGAVPPTKSSNNPQYKMISLSIKDEFKTQVQNLMHTDKELKHRIASISNYLRHVAYYYLSTIENPQPQTNPRAQNPIIFDHYAIYQIEIKFDPTYQTYQIMIPGFKNYQVIVTQVHQIDTIVNNFKHQLTDMIKHHPEELTIKKIAEHNNHPAIKTFEIAIDLENQCLIDFHIDPQNQQYLLQHHLDINQWIEQHKSKNA